jgi:hypothetical protein
MKLQVSRHVVAIPCFALLLTVLVGLPAIAQTTYGSIVGTAHDSSGAAMPGVRVRAVNHATGVNVAQDTNDSGAYSFTTLFPGNYTIHAETTGFRPVDISGIQLEVNQTARYDLTMQVGQVSERVEVSAALATLATDTSDIGQVIENRQILDLPLNGRQYLQLASLTNGVTLSGSKGGESAGPVFTSQGVRFNSDSFLVGGVETRTVRNSTYGLSLSVDAIGEFKILQNSFSAEYGRAASIVNATIKSGTNDFHGSAFEFLRNNALDARYSYQFSGKKAPLRQNEYGASGGGPILRNRAFFFLNYEGERVRKSGVANVLMPTEAQLNGDLSSMKATAIDPVTGMPFPGNIIPANRISQFAKAGSQYFRRPNGSPLPGFNFTAITGEQSQDDQGTARIDYLLNDKIRFNGFTTFSEFTDFSPAANEYSGSLSTRKTKPTMAVEYTHILSPTLLNNLRFGQYHSVIYSGQEKTAASNLAGTDFGFRNVNPEAYAFAPPGMGISGFQWAGPNAWQPSGATDINTQINDQFSITRGRHIVKIGADLRWLHYDDLGWATQNGEYSFNGQYTGNAMGDFLLGLPSYAHIAQRGLGNYSYGTRWGEYSFFVQDDIKVTPELTINAGLRYELVQFPREINNQFDNWNFKTMSMDFAGKGLAERILPTPKGNVGPRFGIAYAPRALPKTVFRGGFAIMYGNYRQYESGLQHFQPPYVDESFLNNDVPNPRFTTATLWPAPVQDLNGVDLTNVTLNYLRDKKVPTYYNWNFNIQKELPFNILLQVGYVGNKGVNLPNRYDANQAVQFDPSNPLPIAARRPYPTLGFISANASSTYSNYNGFDIHVERRFTGGFSLIGNYTWSKSMGIRTFDNYTVMLEDNIRRSYGPQGSAHRSVISYLYELPFGPGKRFLGSSHGVVGQVVGGWQINGITTMQSGAFLSTSSDVNSGTDSRAGNEADATGQPANLARDQRTRAKWFNTAAFVAPPFTRYGNAGEGVILGPGAINFDISMFKDIRPTERTKLQFRLESFNALNHVNLSNPNTNVSDKLHFGVISSAAAARIVQLGLKFYY